MKKNLALAILSVLVIIAAGVAMMKSNQLSQSEDRNIKLQEQLVIKETGGRLLVEKIGGGWEWNSPEAYALVKGEMPNGITLTPKEGGYLVKQGSTTMFFVQGEFSPKYWFSK